MVSKDQKKKPYSPPTLTKLTLEQAKRLGADRKNCGEEEADLLEMPDAEISHRPKTKIEKGSMTPEKRENAISGILKKRLLVPHESDVTEQ
jgi:hypothetical protein